MTNERKAYGAILVAAVGFLVWSQVPTVTAAGAAGADPAGLLAAKPGGTVAPSPLPQPVTIVSVADRLRSYGNDTHLDPAAAADAFYPQSSWVASLVPSKDKDAAAAAAAKPAVVAAATLFPQRHKLDAILASKLESRALIDGQVLSIGQSVDGFKLASLTQTTAVLESTTGVQVILHIVDPMLVVQQQQQQQQQQQEPPRPAATASVANAQQ